MAENRAPGLYLESLPPVDQSVSPLRTDIAGFVGLAARGPVGQPVAVTSREQFQAVFGGALPGSYLAHAVRAFFEAGGRTLYVVRVAGPYGAANAGLTLQGSGGPALALTATSAGAWANGLQVSVTPARRGATRVEAWAPGGDWARVESASGFHAGSVVRVSGQSAVVDRVQGRQLFFRQPLQEVPEPGAFLQSREFHLHVQLGREMEEYRFLGVDEAHPHYYGRAVNGLSRLVQIAPAAPFAPVDGHVPERQRGALTGGADGLEGLSPTAFAEGLERLAEVTQVSTVAVPDVMARMPQPRGLGRYLLDEVGQQMVRQMLIEHCESRRDRFAIIDPPPGLTPQGVADWREAFDSRFAAVYYPWLLVSDPGGAPGSTLLVPPSGHMAGLYAQSDLQEGVHRAPANLAVPGVLALEWNVREAEQAMLNPVGVNCVRIFPGLGPRVWGARTLSSDGAWRYVPVRRLMSMIEKALVEATAWAVFEPHTVRLRFQIVNAVSSFLQELWRAGALAGGTPEEGFYVKCDEETNPAGVIDAGMLVTEIGVAPVRPAEFVVVRIERSRDGSQVREVEL